MSRKLPRHTHTPDEGVQAEFEEPLSEALGSVVGYSGKGMLEVESGAPALTNQQMVDLIWGFESGVWLPQNLTIPTGDGYIRFKDRISKNYFDVSLLIASENYDAPLLAFSQGVIVKKDLTVGGFLGANQGALYLGSGLLSQLDIPKIILMHSGREILYGIDQFASPPDDPKCGQMYINTGNSHLYQWNGNSWIDLGHTNNYQGYFDTLYIKKINGDVGHLACANITARNINSMAHNTYGLGAPDNSWLGACITTLYANAIQKIGGAPFIWALENMPNQGASGTVLTAQGTGNPPIWADLSGGWNGGTVTNNIIIEKATPILQLKNTSGNPELHFNTGENLCKIYGSVTGTPHLRMDKPLVVDQDLWCQELAVDADAGIKGTLIVGEIGEGDPNVSIRHYSDHGWITSHKGGLFLGSAGQYVMPATEGMSFGSSDQRWYEGYFDLIYGELMGGYDALDDLALVKNYETKTIQVEDPSSKEIIEKEVIDPESLDFLTKDGLWNMGSVNGFLLGCVKKLVLEKESLEKKYNELSARVQALEKLNTEKN